MANPNEKPDAVVPTVVGGVEEYKSSEEIARAHRVFVQDEEKKKEEQQRLTDKQKLHAVLDKHIAKYSKTSEVRKMAKTNGKSADHNLDVAADVVEILEKIKNELR